jgi:selenocysteine-specific elongation factor
MTPNWPTPLRAWASCMARIWLVEVATPLTRAIIGTAGHIDHGKTALIRVLTGQDTDRLKEEKERGISIDLGFAYLTLPDGTRAGVVDVPGHERFIRNMLAGAHGIDLVLFTVAADDGVMPQSEEHLDILHLLGIPRGIFVITKADLVNETRLTEVREEIELLAEGTRLQSAPAIAISSITGAGIDRLREEITTSLREFENRRSVGVFRLPIDRAFVIKGHGTVVTGTAMGAEVRVEQKLRVLPGGELVRVRSIQSHSEAVEVAGFSQRVALNLAGAEKITLGRGQVLVDEKLTLTTDRLDALVEIRPAAKRSLKDNQRVRFFIGTAQTLGRAIVLEEKGEIAINSRGLAQLVLDSPVVALTGDRFVLRTENSQRTIGGGVVLNTIGRKSRSPIDLYRQRLCALRDESGAAAIEALLNLQDKLGLAAAAIALLLNASVAEIEQALGDQRFVKLSLGEETAFTTTFKWDGLRRFVVEELRDHHLRQPLEPGIEMEAMRTRLPYEVEARGFRALADRLARESEIVRADNILRLKSHRVDLAGAEAKLSARVESLLREARFQPPDFKQLVEALSLPPSAAQRLKTLLAAMEREKRIVKVAGALYFDSESLNEARKRLVDHFRGHEEITAAAYRDLIGASRKFAIALLDYFDHSGVTIRIGDARRLRAKS